ncbi:protein farnesyltransferase subunit beta-like [Saccoglossus kowalevskii]|uniref:Protein farnesyltransferase subunit beta n=1 Tax=Saccoglossus kowalevskii TaxID=10224 RepID=A0ABM0GR45_SACKO|nr:PREDICTED: protein farnesyltransferase subunit beta-like [Saccoglossus kowalevskii]
MALPVRCVEDLEKLQEQRFVADGVPTASSIEQERVEASVGELFERFSIDSDANPNPLLYKDRHIHYLLKGLKNLSESYECLDASRPWLCYWILHSLYLLGEQISEEQSSRVVQFLKRCQDPDGGFAGGPGQCPHLAPTYAAISALCTLGSQEAYDIIDRPKLQQFLLRMKTPEGGFMMHDGGEIDIRGAYCAAVSASLTNVATKELFEGSSEWISSCQTYEGGFSGMPGMEAHGGYSFCGYAALVILGRERLCDTKSLLRWTVSRQMRFEGGFQGRTNKLVDGCYSLWQAGVLPLLHMVLSKQGDKTLSGDNWMFDQGALQEYVLICCQHFSGGLIDKPGKSRDHYHTCYCLSGLSVAQHFTSGSLCHESVLGHADNELRRVHPLYNIGLKAALDANKYFTALQVPGSKD